jgi:alpha-tubulin suppressor-like RCC1 family protein
MSYKLLTCLASLTILAITSCADDVAKADPFQLDEPPADMTSAPDLATTPDMPTNTQRRPTLTHIAVGAGHMCVITDAGALYCWGRNTSGQVGVGSEADSIPTPTLVPGMERDVIAVSTGDQSTCAIKEGSLYCWGKNTAPLIADQPARLTTPKRHSAIERSVTAVSTSGAHTCVVRAGRVYCWGQNDVGQLGYEVPSQQPRIVEDVTGQATSVSVGADRSCAISDGALWCWGDNTAYLNDTDGAGAKIRPTLLREADLTAPLDEPVIQVGEAHSCLVTGRALSCWGKNTNGQLGTPDPDPGNSARNEPLLTDINYVVAGANRTCINMASAISCWGDLTHGLPDEPGRPSLRAVDKRQFMRGMERGLSAVAVGPYNTCAIFYSATIVCLGDAQFGQLPEPARIGISINLLP